MDIRPEYIYARGKLADAVEALAIGEGDVRSRLLRALMATTAVTRTDFPLELQAEWEWIIRESTKFGPRKGQDGTVWQGAYEHTMFKIRRSTGAKIAERILSLYRNMDRLMDG
jgi:hypothetical protein